MSYMQTNCQPIKLKDYHGRKNLQGNNMNETTKKLVEDIAREIWIANECLNDNSTFHYMSQEQLNQLWDNSSAENKNKFIEIAQSIHRLIYGGDK